MMDSEMLFRCGVGRELNWCFRNDRESLMGKIIGQTTRPLGVPPALLLLFHPLRMGGVTTKFCNGVTGTPPQ